MLWELKSTYRREFTAALEMLEMIHAATGVEDLQDALLNTWILAWVDHALLTDPLNLFNANTIMARRTNQNASNANNISGVVAPSISAQTRKRRRSPRCSGCSGAV